MSSSMPYTYIQCPCSDPSTLSRSAGPSSPTELDAALKGVDTLICTTHYSEIDKQLPLVDAAKRVGVKRFIPNDWASPCVRGVMRLHDQV